MKKATLSLSILFLTMFLTMGFSISNKKSKEEKFWIWFVNHHETFHSEIENIKKREKIYDKISNQLKKIEPDLTFEFGPILENQVREFTISAEGVIKLFPKVDKLINEAPKLKKWKFTALRQRVPGDHYEVQYGDSKISYSDVYYRYQDGEYGEIGIELYIKNYDHKLTTQDATHLLLDGLIGEYDYTHGIKWIEWVELSEANVQNLDPIINLRKLLDSKKRNTVELFDFTL